MLVTIYFKSGTNTKIIINSFSEIDNMYNIDDISRVEVENSIYGEDNSPIINQLENEEILKLKERIRIAEEERLNGKGMTVKEVKENLEKTRK
ncbi:hypothetical protein HMPREF1092_02948 [Clostridium thermobutyricum]|uniref:Uncharacterized protein n=1 Tax=Clostridium thermobutyricum TaxID=29372 RepID=N9XJE7_9CLOT|nr:hypothetical protein [Clostridium thermobutyricum]ENY99812.1 hypothetical protein HMPREF1092_02948 [Clostridium thermobutyricum]